MKSNNMQKVFAAILPLSLILFSCQMEAPVLLQEMEQQPAFSTQANQTNPDALKGGDTSPKTDVILGVTQVRVQFDPAYGKFYPANGNPTQNPINHDLTTGYHITPPPHITPYKTGTNFKGWVRDYPYPGLTFTEKDFWNFEQDILTESMNLYAYFEDSENPDPEPKIVTVSPSITPNYSGNLLDLGLKPTPIPEEKLDADGRYRLFSTGVSKAGGWLNNPQYKNNCWATSASQMLYWYQQQVQAISSFDATEKPMQTTDKVMEMRNYFADWKPGQGSHISWALEKYFDDFYRADRRQDLHRYGGNSSQYFTLETLSAILYKHLSRGDVGGICGFTFDGGNHAMNIYGAEFDKDGLVTALYITSSPTLDSEDKVASHTPRLYESRRSGNLNKGSYEWVANYEYRGEDGYLRTSQHLFSRIWCLDFLSVDRYK